MNRRSFIKNSALAISYATFSAGNRADAREYFSDDTNGFNYSLPALANNSRLLFQGDSITDMNWGRNPADRSHYLGHSYVYLIAARLGVEMAGSHLEFHNRAMNGNKISDLQKRWQKDSIDLNPDLLSILIGTNDAAGRTKPEAFEFEYRQLLELSRAANPKLIVVLLDPFALQSGSLAGDGAWSSHRMANDKLCSVVEKLAKEYDAIHIKTQGIFDAAAKAASPDYWIWDGFHPLPQGHELIARQWIEKVSTLLPQSTTTKDQY